jgi:hypothetical protein
LLQCELAISRGELSSEEASARPLGLAPVFSWLCNAYVAPIDLPAFVNTAREQHEKMNGTTTSAAAEYIRDFVITHCLLFDGNERENLWEWADTLHSAWSGTVGGGGCEMHDFIDVVCEVFPSVKLRQRTRGLILTGVSLTLESFRIL